MYLYYSCIVYHCIVMLLFSFSIYINMLSLCCQFMSVVSYYLRHHYFAVNGNLKFYSLYHALYFIPLPFYENDFFLPITLFMTSLVVLMVTLVAILNHGLFSRQVHVNLCMPLLILFAPAL